MIFRKLKTENLWMDLRPHKKYLQMWMTSLGCKILYSLAQLLCLYTVCLHSKVFYSTEPSKLSIQRSLQLAQKFVTCHLLNLSPSGLPKSEWTPFSCPDYQDCLKIESSHNKPQCLHTLNSQPIYAIQKISYTFLLTLYYTHSYVINSNKSVCTTSNHLGSSVQHGWKMI